MAFIFRPPSRVPYFPRPHFVHSKQTGAYTLIAAAGTFTLTGQDANLLAARVITAAQASFTLTGQAANLYHGFLVSAAHGSFGLAGVAATLRADRLLTAAAGSFTLTGQSANLLCARIIVSAAGAFTISGQSANLHCARIIVAASGTFTLTGQSAGLYAGRLITAGAGSFTLSGQSAELRAARLLTAAVGSFVITGQSANLTYSNQALVTVRTVTIPSVTRSVTLTAYNRTVLIPSVTRSVALTTDRAMHKVSPKAPADVDKFTWSWGGMLAAGETVSTFTAVVTQGTIVVDSTGGSGSDRTAMISGGTAGEWAIVRGRAVTSAGRQLDVSYYFEVATPTTLIDPKDPDDIDDITFKWARLLADGETVSTFTTAIDAGTVAVSQTSLTSPNSTARVTGGAANETARVRGKITTNQSRTLNWAAEFPVQGL